MVVKKQLKKISKKILILGLATSIIFTSCFSTKKIDVKAMGLVATISAWTAYDICLYLGSIALGALGVGAIYESRDDIAEFGKAFVDHVGKNMENNPDSWIFGTYNDNGSTVYGPEVFEAVGSMAWDYIKEGGLTPSTSTDLNGDGYVDISDKDFELENANFWTTSNGAEYLKNQLKILYNDYIVSNSDSLLGEYVHSKHLHKFNDFVFSGSSSSNCEFYTNFLICGHEVTFVSDYALYLYYDSSMSNKWNVSSSKYPDADIYIDGVLYGHGTSLRNVSLNSLLPIFYGKLGTIDAVEPGPFVALNTDESNTIYRMINNFTFSNALSSCNACGTFTVADWSNEEEDMNGILTDISTSLRSLQDISDMCMAITSSVAGITDSMDIVSDLVAEVVGTYNPVIDIVIPTPIPWNPDITRPITSADIPKDIVTDTDLPMPDGPSQDDNDEDNRLDLNGALSLFNILFYLIMILIMLIGIFLACLGFIAMIFRIPASSSMLPEEMVMGFEHLDEIMIPIMNISIYDFAMALIYLLIIFSVIRLLRLEINDFQIPKPWKKG